MAKTKDWVVTTSGERSLHDVATELRESGFKIDQILDEIGAITGTGGDDVARKLRKVKGVSDVSANAGADIGPPGSDDTW